MKANGRLKEKGIKKGKEFRDEGVEEKERKQQTEEKEIRERKINHYD